MKTNLTLKFSFLFMLLTGIASFSYAQTRFAITAPASIAQEYEFMQAANWGGAFPDCLDNFDLSGELVIADDTDDSGGTGTTTDACQDSVQMNVMGKYALIDRGLCEFATKALHAQNAGALGVMICNNDPADGLPPLGAGADADQVTIPVWGITFDDCVTIRNEIANGTVTFDIFWAAPPPGNDVIIWGDQPGQGDFDGGLNGWTTNDITCANGGTTPLWVYSADATAIQGAFSAGGGVSQAVSACNGAMAFDSDFYDNNGDGGNLGGGDCTAVQQGELISPAIDLSTLATDVNFISLRWHQATRQFTSTYIVSYSNDGGNTWFDIVVNDDIETNSPHLNETRRVILPDADLSSTDFRVKFRYEANYYYWIIDDVQIIEAESNNLQVNNNFYAIANNALTPESQLECFSFLADIANVGAEPQPNTNLNVNITDAGGASVASYDLSYGTVEADTTVENIPFTDQCHLPVGSAGDTFTGTYFISSDSTDFDESNNSVSFQFAISDSTYAKEFAPSFGVRPADASWMGAEDPHAWAWGNAYQVINGSEVDDPSEMFIYFAGSVTFGVEALPADQIVSVGLYEWADLNNDGDINTDEREQIAVANYLTDGTEVATNLITLPLQPFDPLNPAGTEGRIEIKNNTSYAVMVEYATSQVGLDMEVAGADGWEYNAQTFRTSQTEFGDVPYRPSPFIAIGTPGDVDFGSGSFANIVPVARLNLRAEMIVGVDELDAANLIQLSPNPANDYVNVSMELVNVQEQVQVDLVDVTGKTIYSNVMENVSNENFQINTAGLTPGAYFVHVITEEGVRTERLLIQR